jgi:alpha-1,3-mannosyltransferase
MGAVIESIQILGSENCALSVVEGRSTDGTKEILYALDQELKNRNIKSFFQTSELNPSQGDRIAALAALRNLALKPYVDQPKLYSDSATIIFLNDISLCTEDILEMIYQKEAQKADMTCAMDWTYVGPDPTFYDVWIARGMTGDSFFNVPSDGNWNSAWNIFWNDPEAKTNYDRKTPFQVFSCWNGITAFTAKPLQQKKISFRPSRKEECWQGEPKLFCKDFWFNGYGKIAVVPSVNVEYSDEAAKKIKDLKGYVHKWTTEENDARRIEWKKDPPEKVKCMPSYDKQEFVPWDEGL